MGRERAPPRPRRARCARGLAPALSALSALVALALALALAASAASDAAADALSASAADDTFGGGAGGGGEGASSTAAAAATATATTTAATTTTTTTTIAQVTDDLKADEESVELGLAQDASSDHKTITSLIDSALEKEFRKDELLEEQGKAGGTAGRSFNKSVTQATAVLETVARVTTDRKEQREAPEREEGASDKGGGGGGAASGASSSAGANAPSSKYKAAPGGGAPGTAPASWSLYGMMQAIEALAASNGLTSAPDVGEDVARLIDSQDNEYVLSSPKRAMELQQDLRLIADFVTIVTAAAVGGLLFAMAGQPMITGYLVAGACVGPGGMGVIKELVQVETLSQVGVVLLLFCLGLEFSMAKLRAVRGVAVGGGLLQVGMLMLMIGATSKSLGAPVAEGVFIGAFLSMSSTAVVLKLCAERDAMATVYGQITIGTLVTQDVLVGVLFALLPVLGGSGDVQGGFAAMAGLALRMALFLAGALLLSRRAVGPFLRALQLISGRSGGEELFQMVVVAFCLVVAWASDALGLSIEMGAFVAGTMISSTEHAQRTLHHVEPIRNLFAAMFLASIGMVINPSFLWLHLDILLLSLLLVIVAKTAMFGVVVRSFGYSSVVALQVGMSMSQIGEFAFVLLSRASALGLVHHRLYLLLLGTTALSLVTTPVVFYLMPHMVRLGVRSRFLLPDDPQAGQAARRHGAPKTRV